MNWISPDNGVAGGVREGDGNELDMFSGNDRRRRGFWLNNCGV